MGGGDPCLVNTYIVSCSLFFWGGGKEDCLVPTHLIMYNNLYGWPNEGTDGCVGG